MSEKTRFIQTLEKQLRMLRKKLDRSEQHRADVEDQRDRDQLLYKKLHAEVEAARREAEIEAALERVRARTMAMRHSDELAETASVLFQQLEALAMLPPQARTYIALVDSAMETAEVWMTQPDGSVRPGSHRTPLTEHPSLRRFYGAWKRGEPICVRDYSGAALDDYLGYVLTLPHAANDEGYQRLAASPPERIVMTDAPFPKGTLGVMTADRLEPNAQKVLQRFARVFEQTYTRFEDLQQAEADNQALLEEKALTEQTLEELRATQTQLVHSEKMASLGALTAGIAHEIKNPLNFVNNFASLSKELVDELEEETDPDERRSLLADLKANAAKIEEHGKRADGIVRSMMQHASGKDEEKRPVMINDMVEEYVNLAYHGKRAQRPNANATIERDYGDNVGELMIVGQDIGRVLVNLINNAFDAVFERADSGEVGYEPTIRIVTVRETGNVVIRISDNGSGMADAVQERIFEPFFTTKPTGQGTGLGLSMSYDIVTQGHGGTLTVESEEGVGSTFVIRLPA